MSKFQFNGNVQTSFIGSGAILINGRRYTGSSVTMRDGQIIIDGKAVNEDEPKDATGKPIVYRDCTIVVEGDVTGDLRLEMGIIKVAGNVGGSISTASGSVTIEKGDVGGSATSMSGNVTVGGDCRGTPSSMSGNVTVLGKKTAQ